MPVKYDEFDGVGVLTIGTDMESDQASAAMTAVHASIEDKGVVDLVVDLTGCSFINSEGLEMLLDAKRRCEESFGRFGLAACDEGVMKILDITRLRSRFEVSGTVEDAMRRMRA